MPKKIKTKSKEVPKDADSPTKGITLEESDFEVISTSSKPSQRLPAAIAPDLACTTAPAPPPPAVDHPSASTESAVASADPYADPIASPSPIPDAPSATSPSLLPPDRSASAKPSTIMPPLHLLQPRMRPSDLRRPGSDDTARTTDIDRYSPLNYYRPIIIHAEEKKTSKALSFIRSACCCCFFWKSKSSHDYDKIDRSTIPKFR